MRLASLLLAILGVLLAPMALGARIALRPSADIAGVTLRLGDIADLSSLSPAMRQQAAPLVVAELKHTGTTTRLLAEPLASRARAQMPLLRDLLSVEPGQYVEIRASSRVTVDAPSPRTCWRLQRSLAAGRALLMDQLDVLPCPAARTRASIHYDVRQHVVRANQDLAAGTLLGPIAPELLAHVARGQALVVEWRLGHVQLQRQVTALQDAPSGHPVFVQTAQGDVLTALLPESAP